MNSDCYMYRKWQVNLRVAKGFWPVLRDAIFHDRCGL